MLIHKNLPGLCLNKFLFLSCIFEFLESNNNSPPIGHLFYKLAVTFSLSHWPQRLGFTVETSKQKGSG